MPSSYPAGCVDPSHVPSGWDSVPPRQLVGPDAFRLRSERASMACKPCQYPSMSYVEMANPLSKFDSTVYRALCLPRGLWNEVFAGQRRRRNEHVECLSTNCQEWDWHSSCLDLSDPDLRIASSRNCVATSGNGGVCHPGRSSHPKWSTWSCHFGCLMGWIAPFASCRTTFRRRSGTRPRRRIGSRVSRSMRRGICSSDGRDFHPSAKVASSAGSAGSIRACFGPELWRIRKMELA